MNIKDEIKSKDRQIKELKKYKVEYLKTKEIIRIQREIIKKYEEVLEIIESFNWLMDDGGD